MRLSLDVNIIQEYLSIHEQSTNPGKYVSLKDGDCIDATPTNSRPRDS